LTNENQYDDLQSKTNLQLKEEEQIRIYQGHIDEAINASILN
jgi:hypothetical protein